ncbi:MAG: GlsB/YeaQ/YmgE family stress response membrane protein [Chloroflexi bacterium]|nr:GlsB/YeaQ/YmgE family stress response membrane protein [Chloroflexota bacterium]
MAGQILRGQGFSLLTNILLGLAGGIVGSLLFGLVGLGFGGVIGNIVVGVVGAVIVIYGWRALSGDRSFGR